jgi:hypothetical protein
MLNNLEYIISLLLLVEGEWRKWSNKETKKERQQARKERIEQENVKKMWLPILQFNYRHVVRVSGETECEENSSEHLTAANNIRNITGLACDAEIKTAQSSAGFWTSVIWNHAPTESTAHKTAQEQYIHREHSRFLDKVLELHKVVCN